MPLPQPLRFHYPLLVARHLQELSEDEAMTERRSKRQPKSYRAEVWQGGVMVIDVDGVDQHSVEREIKRYAALYGLGGQVEVRYPKGKP